MVFPRDVSQWLKVNGYSILENSAVMESSSDIFIITSLINRCQFSPPVQEHIAAFKSKPHVGKASPFKETSRKL